MTTNSGLTIFKKALLTKPKFKAQAKRLCFLNTTSANTDYETDNTAVGYADDIVIKMPQTMPGVNNLLFKQYADFHLVNSFNHLKHYKTNLIDVMFYTQKQYQKLLLVINNKILAYCKAHYQVALLDATADYFLNYYLDCTRQSVPDDLQHTLQCLVFINPDGSYFLALPCICNENELIDAQAAMIMTKTTPNAIIKTTVKQIEQLLDPIPLLRTAQISWLKLRYINTYLEQADDFSNNTMSYAYMGYYDQVTGIDYFEHVGISRIKQIGKIYHSDQLQAKKICRQALYQSVSKRSSTQRSSYFEQHLHAELRQGFLHIDLKPTNKRYQQLFQEIDLHDLPQLQQIPTYNNYQIGNYFELVNCYQQLVGDEMGTIFDFTTNKKVILAKELPIKQTVAIKPLVKDKGLSKVMLNLVDNANKPYYLVNKTLITLGGKQKINWIRQTKLL